MPSPNKPKSWLKCKQVADSCLNKVRMINLKPCTPSSEEFQILCNISSTVWIHSSLMKVRKSLVMKRTWRIHSNTRRHYWLSKSKLMIWLLGHSITICFSKRLEMLLSKNLWTLKRKLLIIWLSTLIINSKLDLSKRPSSKLTKFWIKLLEFSAAFTEEMSLLLPTPHF